MKVIFLVVTLVVAFVGWRGYFYRGAYLAVALVGAFLSVVIFTHVVGTHLTAMRFDAWSVTVNISMGSVLGGLLGAALYRPRRL